MANISQRQLEMIIERRVSERLPVIVQQQLVHTSYSGPMPQADESAKYEQICQGFTNRWVTMSEVEQRERFKMLRRRDWMDIGYKLSSLGVGGVAVLALLLGGLWLLSNDRSVAGFGSIGVAASMILAAALLKKPKAAPQNQKEQGQ